MPDETTKPEPAEEKKREVKIRDLTPKSDAKGGAAKGERDEKPTVRRTGEIDFMEGVN
jgi:hypothetical protein